MSCTRLKFAEEKVSFFVHKCCGMFEHATTMTKKLNWVWLSLCGSEIKRQLEPLTSLILQNTHTWTQTLPQAAWWCVVHDPFCLTPTIEKICPRAAARITVCKCLDMMRRSGQLIPVFHSVLFTFLDSYFPELFQYETVSLGCSCLKSKRCIFFPVSNH